MSATDPQPAAETARSCGSGAANCSAFLIALYATAGPRLKRHRVVLYIAFDKDWTAKSIERNGHHGQPLAIANSTQACEQFRDNAHRARSLQYSGKKPQDVAGLREDLETLGYDAATVERFATAAAPYLQNAGGMAAGADGQPMPSERKA